MKDVSEQLDDIRKKLKRALEEHVRQSEQLNKLKTENQRLNNKLEEKEEEINIFKEKMRTAQIAQSVETGEDKREIKQKINNYIKEIDRCIALLND